MSIQVLTRHGEEFDILTDKIDPTKSHYARFFGNNYVTKISAFYAELGTRAVMWTRPISQPFDAFEPSKSIEYLLEIPETRVVAFVDELTWSAYLHGKCKSFRYSRLPIQYESTSVLVTTPIKREEVKEVRQYRASPTGHCELVKTQPFVFCRL
jgi:hypothetical protein